MKKLTKVLKAITTFLTKAKSGDWITPEDTKYAPFKVGLEYMHKHKPYVGGYYVVYADGYKSFSPADVFENGYTKLN